LFFLLGALGELAFGAFLGAEVEHGTSGLRARRQVWGRDLACSGPFQFGE
jgi:hypothetical protein